MLVTNTNEKPPQKFVKETNSKPSNTIEAAVNEDWGKPEPGKLLRERTCRSHLPLLLKFNIYGSN